MLRLFSKPKKVIPSSCPIHGDSTNNTINFLSDKKDRSDSIKICMFCFIDWLKLQQFPSVIEEPDTTP